MKHKIRFAINLLAPAPIASVLFFGGITLVALIHGEASTNDLQWFVAVIIAAYLFAGAPSLAHAWWLHRRYKRGVQPRSAHALRLSTISGLAAGCAIGGVFAIGGKTPAFFFIFAALGAATGALNGLLQFLIRERRNE